MRVRIGFLGAFCGLWLALAACAQPEPQTWPILAAVGDIACDPADAAFQGGNGTATRCRMKATSDLLLGRSLDAVLVLGDLQYEDGAAAKWAISYDPSWGRLKTITRPVPGNHEYVTANAAGYYGYFGAAAGDPAKGWYSFDLGGWHLIALNSNCAAVGGCGPGSPQETWLRADLAAHPGVCTLAFWHHPRFSSGPHGNDAITKPFWTALAEAGADLVLNGHDHVYERFAPQNPEGAADPVQGIRQITIGTGGKNLTSFPLVRANSEVRNAAAFGVLELSLAPNGYAWRFLTVPDGAVADSGLGLCHSALPRETDFHPLSPCRVADTRGTNGPQGGPALAAGAVRTFPVAGLCGVPADAVAVAVNVTAVGPASSGHLRVFAAGGAVPEAGAVYFTPGIVRANNAQLSLGVGGQVTVGAHLPSGSVHVVLDVSGYFR